MLEYLINDNLVDKNDRIAVGISGGADSMLLLWALIDKQKEKGFYFEVININHHIRGAESDRDSIFVEEFCKGHKIDYKIIDIDVLKQNLLIHLSNLVNRIKNHDKTYLDTVREHNYLAGKEVIATIENEECRVLVITVADDNRLIVLKDGMYFSLSVGEVLPIN